MNLCKCFKRCRFTRMAAPYVYSHLLLRYNGHFGTSSSIVDKWSTGLRIGFAGKDIAYNSGGLVTFLTAAADAGKSFNQNPGTWAGTNCFLTEATVARVGHDGHYDPVTQETVHSPITLGDGAGSPVHSWNTASVISLRTARPRGYASNGRCYWPALALAVTPATGRVATVSIAARVSLFAAMITAINNAANTYDAGARVIVASSRGQINAPVTAVRSDERLDSIERRENALAAKWSQTSIL